MLLPAHKRVLRAYQYIIGLIKKIKNGKCLRLYDLLKTIFELLNGYSNGLVARHRKKMYIEAVDLFYLVRRV
jgi:hypothetical protein